MNNVYKPGQATPKSGIYDVLRPRGGLTGEQVVSTHNKPLPPTPKSGQTYRLAERAHHHHRRYSK